MKKRRLSANPPSIDEHHVRLPDQMAGLLGASQLHERGLRGHGVRVAVIDSGFFPHPYYVSRGYKITYVPTVKERAPDVDEYGHGTAQLASLFAIAPGVEALVIKCMDRDPSDALAYAIEMNPQVISCAWGFNIDHENQRSIPRSFRKMQQLILTAVGRGITVVAAAGNGQRAFPGSMPEVISAGGVYYRADGTFCPSDVSSRFESSLFPGRRVPDVCGLVGNRPHGRLLLVPVPPRARLARRPSFSTIAAGSSSDVQLGWAMFSGTSAAAAMVSGAAALLLEQMPGLTPAQIRRACIEGGRLVGDSKDDLKLLDVEAMLAVARSVFGGAQG